MSIEKENNKEKIEKEYKDWHPGEKKPGGVDIENINNKEKMESISEPDEGHARHRVEDAKKYIEEEIDAGIESEIETNEDAQKAEKICSNEIVNNPKGMLESFYEHIEDKKNLHSRNELGNFIENNPSLKDNIETYKILSSEDNRKKFTETTEKVSELTKDGKYFEAVQAVQEYYGYISNNLPEGNKEAIKNLLSNENYRKQIGEILSQKGKEIGKNIKDNKVLLNVLSFGLDMVPALGPGKMACEAATGKDLTGRELKGPERLIHGASATLFLILDCTGGGAVASKIGRGALEGGKVFTRFAAAMKVSKAIPKSAYMSLFKLGRWMITHPEQAKGVNKLITETIKNRKTIAKLGEQAVNEVFKSPEPKVA